MKKTFSAIISEGTCQVWDPYISLGLIYTVHLEECLEENKMEKSAAAVPLEGNLIHFNRHFPCVKSSLYMLITKKMETIHLFKNLRIGIKLCKNGKNLHNNSLPSVG